MSRPYKANLVFSDIHDLNSTKHSSYMCDCYAMKRVENLIYTQLEISLWLVQHQTGLLGARTCLGVCISMWARMVAVSKRKNIYDGPMYTPKEHLPKWHDAIQLCGSSSVPQIPISPDFFFKPGKSSPKLTGE